LLVDTYFSDHHDYRLVIDATAVGGGIFSGVDSQSTTEEKLDKLQQDVATLASMMSSMQQVLSVGQQQLQQLQAVVNRNGVYSQTFLFD